MPFILFQVSGYKSIARKSRLTRLEGESHDETNFSAVQEHRPPENTCYSLLATRYNESAKIKGHLQPAVGKRRE